MASLQFAVTVIVLTTGLAQAAPSDSLLPGLYTCAADNPYLKQCLITNANIAIPIVAPGVPSLKLMQFDPLHENKLHIDNSDSTDQVAVDLRLKNVDFVGLAGMTVTDASIDGDLLSISAVVPQLDIVGDYKVTGSVFTRPIFGEGTLNIEIVDVNLLMTFTISRGLCNTGAEVIRVEKSTLDFENGQFDIRLDNLFDEDMEQGDDMNEFLNENLEDLLKQFGPSFSEIVNKAAFKIINRLFSVFPEISKLFES